MRAKVVLPALLALVLSLTVSGLALSLVGDVVINGIVDSADMSLISAAYQSRSGDASWNWRADLTRDGDVDISDLTVAGRSFGDTFNFHWPRRLSNGKPTNPALTTVVGTAVAVDGRGRVHVVWEEAGSDCPSLHYTQLDMAGNTMVDDIQIAHHGAEARVAADETGNAYIVWHDTCSGLDKPNVLYTKIAPNGSFVIASLSFADSLSGSHPVVAPDALGHAHLMSLDPWGRQDYSIVDERGSFLLNNAPINIRFPNFPSGGGGEGAVEVDKEGTRHLLWHQNTGAENILSYTRILSNGITALNQVTVIQLASWNNKPLYVRADSQGAAHFVWKDSPLGSIYWRRIDRNGNFSAVRLVTTEAPSASDISVQFVVDSSDRIHIVTRDTRSRVGYTRLDRDGNVLVPFRAVAFPGNRMFQGIGMDSQGNAVAVYAENDATPHALYVISTVPDVAANDPTRADLSLDYSRAYASSSFVRIIDHPTLTITVVNAGYVTATNIVVSVTKTISPTYLPVANQVIASLPPFSSTTFARVVDIPPFEDQTLLGFRVQASTATPETTLTNNVITLSVVTLPPAKKFNLAVGTLDETNAPTDRSQADYLFGGHLDASARSPMTFTGEVTFTQAYNYFFDVPLDAAKAPQMTTTMMLTLTAPGFSTATQVVTATRDLADPYRVTITPSLAVMMYLNRWGTILGTVVSGTTPITNAQVTLDSGAAVTITDASGVFTFTKVVSGTHALESLHAGNEATTATVRVQTQQTATPVLNMPYTSKGYVRGYVTDIQGNPFSGAQVKLWGVGTPTLLATTTANADGYYSFTVANAGAYPNFKVTVDETTDTEGYDSGNFVLTAGIPQGLNFSLSWKVTAASMRSWGDVTSAHITEGWNTTETPSHNPIAGFLWDTFVAPPIEVIKIVSEIDEYEVETEWGKYHYALGLKYSKTAGVPDTVNWVSVDLANYELYNYEVASGPFSGGGESINRTSLHVARVDLVEVDASGNQTAGPFWSSTSALPDGWYANDSEGGPTPWFTAINQAPVDWSKAAIRVFIHVGQLTNSAPYWRPWAPPASVVSLSGGGSYAGADKQTLIWRLSPNTLDVLPSSPYYDYYVSGGDVAVAGAGGEVDTAGELAPTSPQEIAPLAAAAVTVTVPFATAHVGIPFPVDLLLSAPAARPVHGVDFDFTFDRTKFQVTGVGSAPDFLGPYGAWTVITPTTLAQINASGRFTHTAVVSLGSPTGITQGRLVRINFLPISTSASTKLDLVTIRLADHNGDTSSYSIGPVVDATVAIDSHQVFLPVVRR